MRCDDPDARVTGDCFTALLELDAAGSLDFVAAFLDHANAALAEGAALALGESRAERALGLLQSWLGRSMDPELQNVAYTAIALLRSDAGSEFLIGEIGNAPARRACQVVSVLGMHRGDEKVRSRVERAVAQRDERAVREAYRDAFE